MPPAEPVAAPSRRQANSVIATLVVGYIGVYLCRKNFSVAVPLLQDAFGASKQQVGRIASVSTAAYAAGKIFLGPLVDRIGGRAGFLLALGTVALFGGLGGLAPGLFVLGGLYSLNRFAGAGAWGAMMKLTPSWFAPGTLGTAAAVVSVSYVLGGIAAVLLARQIVDAGFGWRVVMGFPAFPLIAILAGCAVVVRQGPLVPAARAQTKAPADAMLRLLLRPQFLVVCAMSLTLTLMRESFNTWSVDFLTSVQEAGKKSVAAAALGSTTFDLAGIVSILGMGYI
jgi:OPA family glycerol-3-phosphate transporter-like MFS transporter